MSRTLCLLFALLLAAALPCALAQEPKPPELTPEEQKLAEEARKLQGDGYRLKQTGQFAEALAKMQAALKIREKLFPMSKYPNGHVDLAGNLNQVGVVLHDSSQPEKAIPFYMQSLDMHRRLYATSQYRDGQPIIAIILDNLGFAFSGMGQDDKALPYFQQSLEMRLKFYPASKFPDGHADLVIARRNVGTSLKAMGKPVKALPYFEKNLEMCRKLYPASKYPNGHAMLAGALSYMGWVLDPLGGAAKALPYHQQALEMFQSLYPVSNYPDGHIDLAVGLNNVGWAWTNSGQAEKGLPFCRQSLEMRRKLYPASKCPDGHPQLVDGLNSLGSVLRSIEQVEEALPLYQESLEISKKLYPLSKYPDGHPDLVRSLNNLGSVHKEARRFEKALSYQQQSLDMCWMLYPLSKYPDGHALLAATLSNIGSTLESMGQAEKALPLHQQSYEMRQKLYPKSDYPNGHSDLVASLYNLGNVWYRLGKYDKSLEYHQQSEGMKTKHYLAQEYPSWQPSVMETVQALSRALAKTGNPAHAQTLMMSSVEKATHLYPESQFPDGHLAIVTSRNELAFSLLNNRKPGFEMPILGRVEQSRRLALDVAIRQLEISKQLAVKLFPKSKYPDGHPALSETLYSLAYCYHARGQPEKALPLCEQNLEIEQKRLRHVLFTVSEEGGFDNVRGDPQYRLYLSVTRNLDVSASQCYQTIWPSRSVFTRIIDQRHANARAAGTTANAKLDQLRGNRRRMEKLLQDTQLPANERDQLLVKYADECDRLERELLAEIPALKRWEEFDKLGPADLVEALPPGAVFIDLFPYTRYEFNKEEEKWIPTYVAFVLRKPTAKSNDASIVRIELQDAAPIDAAIRQWRTAIDERREAPEAVAELARLVWQPIAKQLPPGTKTLYLATEGDLARLPWAALPVSKDRILLEEFAVAQVPHGMFLLDHLKFPRTFSEPNTFLALGDVDYGKGIWPAIPGTLSEIKATAAMAPAERETLRGKEANVDSLSLKLSKARWAHLATHGQFKADELAQEQIRAAKALEARLRSDEPRVIAAKNPLGFVGLVLANGEVLSGLSIIDLNLNNLQLVTLSACETGLGDYTGGEGVQGLQRAFHLAGCPNAVASLWNVNDSATAALMAKFYHEMWVNNKPPIEALREAQLTIYHHPELIAELAGERGAPNQKRVLELSPEELAPAKPQAAKWADTKLWAAFVLSGLGK